MLSIQKMKIDYYIKYWLPIVFWMWLIYYISSFPSPLEQIIPEKALAYFDFEHFIYHIIEYAILSFLLYRALKITSKNPQILAILITILYGIIDELHQYFVPGRILSIVDILIDLFGAIVMQSVVNIYNWFNENK